ncbi:MAG: hypothetical protein ACRDU4_00740 [Mycobacterium sp.]
MTVGTPRTWASADALTAALANAEFRDQFIAEYGPPTGRLWRTGANGPIVNSQTVGTLHTTFAAGNLMTFDQSLTNTWTGAMTTGSTPWSQLTAPIDGIYEADGMNVWDGGTSPAYAALLVYNGATILDCEVRNQSFHSDIVGPSGITSSLGNPTCKVGTSIKMVAGDTVRLYGTQASGSTKQMWGGSLLSLAWKGNLA